MSFKIISQNVMCHGHIGKSSYRIRRPILKSVFRNHGADIIAMQEATPLWKLIFSNDLRDFDNVFAYRGKKDKEAVAVYWKRNRFNAIESGYFWLSPTPEIESIGWDAKNKRIACWALLRDKTTNKQFAVINTHLDHIGKKAQINGIKTILNFIRTKFKNSIPIVLTGDFNSQPRSEVLKCVSEFLHDSRSEAKVSSDEITFHGYGVTTPAVIDYIYLTKNISCSKFKIIKEFDKKGRTQSDHCGVFAEINI